MFDGVWNTSLRSAEARDQLVRQLLTLDAPRQRLARRDPEPRAQRRDLGAEDVGVEGVGVEDVGAERVEVDGVGGERGGAARRGDGAGQRDDIDRRAGRPRQRLGERGVGPVVELGDRAELGEQPPARRDQRTDVAVIEAERVALDLDLRVVAGREPGSCFVVEVPRAAPT